MSSITTDLSASPYWDDYDPNKQYYRILFVPKKAVQVREMNQLQQMVQTQISRFGDHIFKDGSIVSGCNVTYLPKFDYVRCSIFNNDNANTNFTTDVIEDFLVVSNTGLRASVAIANPGYVGTYPDTNVMYVRYLNKGRDTGNNEVTTFTSGETLTLYSSDQDKFGALNPGLVYNTIDTYSSSNTSHAATGNAYGITVGDGVVYQKGYFVKVLPHTILVSKYDQNVNGILVGFETTESIITYLQDPSLVDPADTSQRNGIGANRLRLSPTLVAKTRADIESTDDFFPIIEFNEQNAPIKQNTDPEYAKLGDQLAKEKYEESGDFYVKPFIVSTKAVANTQNFAYTVDSGISYVKGNRVQLLNTISLEKERGTSLGFFNNNVTTLNYGNYIVVKELSGTFNADKLVTVDIYDTVQTAITSSRVASAATGTKIGTANVRAVLYDAGVKGTPAGSFKFYLTNILMNSGKSFINDAKSFVVTSANNGLAEGALADIILTDTKAIIQDSAKSGLIFNTGIEGTRRLRDSLGVNDTNFTFRDSATATLQANGSVTFTLNTPYAGGAERFFASPGVLSSVNKLRVDISTTAGLQTVNLAGTINGNTGNTSVVGLGTTFLTDFSVGERLRVNATNYLITAIANNVAMTVSAPITGGNTTATYSKVYTTGQLIDLSHSTVTVVSNTQFIVDLGRAIASGAPQTLIATYPVIRNQAYEIKKNVRNGTYVKIDCSANTSGPYGLGLVDVFSISNIYVGDTYSENNPDRKGWFSIDNGQQQTHYDHARLILKPEYQGKLTASTKILVKTNHFVANTTTGIGFFSADSYPTRNPGDTANTTNISYDDIPEVFGINLRNAVDFRPQKFNTATVTTDPASATVNPAASNTSFNVGVAGVYIGEPDTNFQSDVEYYLPRIDLVQVNKDGVFSVKSSIAAEKPIPPVVDNDAMAIASSYVPPFPGITADLTGVYAANKPKIKTTLTATRGYTMKDINALDKRISVLEYYNALNMLEQQAKDYNVKDENGLDRFKNGVYADPLKNHYLGDVSNFEYNIAIDEDNQLARPKITRNNVDLNVSTTTNAKTNGRIATLDYAPELFISQPYASKFRNVTESVWQWTGAVSLFPEYDHSQDETVLPEVNVEIDLASAWEQFANSPFGQSFGDWRTTGSSTTTTNSGNTSTSTTTTTSSRVINQLGVTTSLTKQDLGSYITDITLNPYIRSRQVAFIATGLRPNTVVYGFFADENVSEFCAPGVLNTLVYDQQTNIFTIDSGKEDQVVNRTADFGTPLVTDDFGNLYGIFNIPAQRFRVGDRQFRLVDVDNLVTGADAILTSAIATYTASSLTTTSRNIAITTINPTLSTSSTTETRVETATTITQRQTGGDGNSGRDTVGGRNNSGSRDPLGQSFKVEINAGVPGIFLDSIEVFFRSKDANMGVTCYITEMNAGVPNTARVVASAYLKPNAINVSNDSSAGTTFKFNDVPYLTNGNYYSFFLSPDGDSPNYTLWMSEVGGTDLLTGDKIFSNPYIGVAFRSANSDSWDTLMTEDIKFNANLCRFSSLSGSVEFVEQDDDFFTVDGFAFANTATTIHVGDVVYTTDGNGVVITGNAAPFGYVQSYDQLNDTLVIDSSTGGFAANNSIRIYRPNQPSNPAAISANNLIATSTIVSVDNIEYSIVVPKIGTVTPTGTAIAYSFKGIDQSEIADPNWTPAEAENEIEFIDKIRVIKSKSNRLAIDNSVNMKIDMVSTDSLLSPIVNLRRRSMMAIDNIVNNDLTNEHTRYGNALVRYLSKPITLAEGQDSEDIKVLLTAYRPAGTDVSVYAKILCADDPDSFYDKFWTKLDMVEGASVFSSSANVRDYREFGYSFPTAEQMQGTAWRNAANDGIVQYRNSSDTIFVGYKTYAIKVVLTSTEKQRVPRLDDIRCLNLQV